MHNSLGKLLMACIVDVHNTLGKLLMACIVDEGPAPL